MVNLLFVNIPTPVLHYLQATKKRYFSKGPHIHTLCSGPKHLHDNSVTASVDVLIKPSS